MEERKVRQIKGALLKCAKQNRNKPTPTFNICISDLCTDAEQYIRELENKIADIKANCDLAIEGRDVKIMELEKQIEKMKCCSNCNHFNKESDIEYCQNCERQLVNSLDNFPREEIIKDEWELKE